MILRIKTVMSIDLELTEKQLKSNQRWIKKHWAGFIIGLIFCCSVTSALFGFKIISISKSGPASVLNVNLNQESSISLNEKNTSCVGEVFEDKLKDWKISHYSGIDKSGFYCPRSSSPFPSPDIWYKNQIPKIFDSIEIKYQSKNKDNSINNPSAFIFSLGEDPRILRFYVSEKDFQVVGFEKIMINKAGQPFEREAPGRILANPIKDGTEISLTIKPVQISGNKIAFSFILNYISDNTGSSMNDTFNYIVDLPDPNPESDYSKTEFGFATLKGDCIKPISYKICK